MNIDKLTLPELEKLQQEKEVETQLALDNLNTVELQDLDIAKKITELQLSRRTLATALTQAKYNLRRVSSELRAIKPMIYKRLRGE